MRIVLFLIFALVGLSACTHDADELTQILTTEGYTDIQPGDHAFFGCGKDDEVATHFTAKKNGMLVEGTVCSGIFAKNATVRIARSTPMGPGRTQAAKPAVQNTPVTPSSVDSLRAEVARLRLAVDSLRKRP